MNDLYHDSIGNEMFGVVFFSRSDEPIVISVRGMRSADQVHRIVSEPIGPRVSCHTWVIKSTMYVTTYATRVFIKTPLCMRKPQCKKMAQPKVHLYAVVDEYIS